MSGVLAMAHPGADVDSKVGAGYAAEGTDEALVERFVAGEARAFDELVARYRDRIFQFIRWHHDVRDATADDLAQEVFLRLHGSARRFRGRSRFRTWLYGLASNVCRDHVRRRSAVKRGSAAPPASEHQAANLTDPGPSPLQAAEAHERQRIVRRAVEALPPHHRSVLVLRDWEDLGYREIAEVLRIPVGTVRSRLFHARNALTTALAPYVTGGDDV